MEALEVEARDEEDLFHNMRNDNFISVFYF